MLAQGVCWLNTSLTFTSTDQADLKRHLTFWRPIVEKIIEVIVEAKSKAKEDEHKAVVFVFWGGHAQKLRKPIEAMNKKYNIDIRFVEANHPAANGDACVQKHRNKFSSEISPFFFHYSFHAVLSFESVNKHLEELGAEPIDWLPSRKGAKRSLGEGTPKATPAKKAAAKKNNEEKEEEKPAKKTAARPKRAAAAAVAKVESDDQDDESSEEEKKARKPPAKRAKKNEWKFCTLCHSLSYYFSLSKLNWVSLVARRNTKKKKSWRKAK